MWRSTVGELQKVMEASGLVVIETEELAHSVSEYFVVARKLEVHRTQS